MSMMGDTGRQLLGIVLGGACVLGASCATAQITPDRTLPNNSNVTINGSVSNITGGTQAGRNLFHSFQQFSVSTGSTAFFNNGLDIQNIFSRVTGGSISTIDGVIRANGTANLFLINPSGIIFGPHASLSLNGSFFASTANSLVFDNGFEFSATNPQAPPMLTVNIPIGLRFRDNPGSIQVQGDGQGRRTTSNLMDTTTGLQVQPNQTLALVGGDINLEGATLKTAGGRIELGSVAGNGLVSLTPDNKGFSLGYSGVQNFGNIQLSKLAAVDASGEGGGDIQVWGRNVTLTDGSEIEASTLGSKAGGSLVVNAQDSVQLIGTSANLSSGLFAQVYEGATGTGGNLIINTHQLAVQGGARVNTDTNGGERGGDLTINDTGQLLVQGGAQVSAGTLGGGNSGNLTVTADSIQLTGTSTDGQFPSSLFTQAFIGSTGDAGNLTINTHQLSIQNGAQVSAGTLGGGNSGNLTVTADSIQLMGTSTDGRTSSGLFTQAFIGSTGDAGNLTINTHQLSVQNGAQVSASTFGAGRGGNLNVTADSIQLTGTSTNGQTSSGLFAQADRGSTGDAGDLTINTHQISVQDGAVVSASTFGAGRGGNLNVTADSIQLTGSSGLFAQGNSGSIGNAGNLTINTHQLAVQDGARVSASTFGAGKGGDLTINDTGQLLVQGGAQVSASTFGAGNSGNLTVTADSIQLTGTSANGFSSGLFAQANSGSIGNAGNLTINTHQLAVQDGARFSASTFGAGKGGDLTINDTGQLLVQGGAQVSASTFGAGNSGNLTVTADSIQLTGTSTDGSSSGLFTLAFIGSTGDAGNLTINTHQLLVQGGAQVSASTFGKGKGGNLTVTADSIQLTGTSTDGQLPSGLFASASSGSTGDAGDLTIHTQDLTIQNGATVSVSSPQGRAGDLTITAKNIRLDLGSLTAETAVTSPNQSEANIRLQGLDLLFLRNNSLISARATSNTANGGNISIDAPNGFVVAVPGGSNGSDIVAGAFGGRGGNIQIRSQSVYGLTPGQSTVGDRTNDIDASSQFNQVFTVYVDPSKGLVELPEKVIDPTTQIAQNPCQRGAGSTFAITGRGGIPYNPNQTLASDNVRVGLVTPSSSKRTAQTTATQTLTQPTVKKSVPAQGWIFNDKGQVVLTAYDPTNTGSQRSWREPASCAKR